MIKSMDVHGLGELNAKLNRLGSVTLDVSQRNIIASCRRIVARAKELAPYRTGELRGAITYSTTTKTRGYVGIRAGSPADVYWRFLEFGTRYVYARPFFRPAAEAEKGRFVDESGRTLRDQWERL